jgi:hypothetical protein
MILQNIDYQRARKTLLLELGEWAVITGRRWLVQAVHAALEWEGLRDA